jgi:hypothetical protein
VADAISDVRMIRNGKKPKPCHNKPQFSSMDGALDWAVSRLKADIRDLRCNLRTLERYLSGQKWPLGPDIPERKA